MSGKYEVLWNGGDCGIGRDVATTADCLEAGRELGLPPGTNSISHAFAYNSQWGRRYCWRSSERGMGFIYFNHNHVVNKGSNLWNGRSICLTHRHPAFGHPVPVGFSPTAPRHPVPGHPAPKHPAPGHPAPRPGKGPPTISGKSSFRRAHIS